MRIVLATSAYGPRTGGVRAAIDRLRALYRQRGHEPVLVIPGDTTARCDDAVGPVYALASPRLPWHHDYRSLVHLPAVARLIRQLDPAAVELHDKWTLPALARRLAAEGRSVLGFSHERLDRVLRPYLGAAMADGAVVRRYNRWFARQFDRVVCHSAFSAAELGAAGAANVDVVPLGVDAELFHPHRREAAWRSQLLAGRSRLLAYAGRLVAEKNVALLARVMTHLEATAPGVYRLAVAGAGPSSAAVAGGPATTMLGFLGDRARVAALYASADALLFPSSIESFGLTVLEALACGCPVAAVAGGAVPEVVLPGAGVLARDEPAALARAVPSALRCRRETARQAALAYPWSRTADALLTLHETALGSGTATSATEDGAP